jgi:RNA polymerase sigma factor CnrH
VTREPSRPLDRWSGPLNTDEDFAKFYTEFRLRAIAFVHSLEPSWDSHRIADVAQDAWVAIYQRIGHIRNAKAYLFMTLSNELRDARQAAALYPVLPDEDLASLADENCFGVPRSDQPEHVVELKETIASIRADLLDLLNAVNRLPETLRVPYRLRKIEGLSAKETAAALGCSPGAVHLNVFRARAALKKQFDASLIRRFEAASLGLEGWTT